MGPLQQVKKQLDDVDANENAFLSQFPYVAAPNQGYAHTGHE